MQLDNGVKVPPSGWKCSECDLTAHLWMNLTDGSVHCGRRYFDGKRDGEEEDFVHCGFVTMYAYSIHVYREVSVYCALMRMLTKLA